MQTMTLEPIEDVAIIRLENGVTNAITARMLDELNETLESVYHRYRGLVLAGNPKFFSMGLHIPSLLELDRNGMSRFMDMLDWVTMKIYTMPIPTAAVISGHAVAGGLVLALSCDFRIADNPKAKIGLNEMKLGGPVPYPADLMLRQIAGDRVATEMIFGGEFVSAEEALARSVIDRMVGSETAEREAADLIGRIGSHSAQAFASAKTTRIESVLLMDEANGRHKHEEFLNCWFERETRGRLEEAAKKF